MSPATKRTTTVDSLSRALIHHGIDYSSPEAGGRRTWIIHTGLGPVPMRKGEVECYVMGLADHERNMRIQTGPVGGVIQRTNPNVLPRTMSGKQFQCCVCESKHDTWQGAKKCAVDDVAHGRRRPPPEPAPADLNSPPCSQEAF